MSAAPISYSNPCKALEEQYKLGLLDDLVESTTQMALLYNSMGNKKGFPFRE